MKARLASRRPLRVKLGIDPTGPKVHLGRAVVLWKLREFQELGHQAVLIFGDFTALIGDSSDKLQRRPVLAKEQIIENVRHYQAQAEKILDFKKAELHYNSEWLAKLTPAELVKLAREVTVNQILARHNFKERVAKGTEIGLDEFLYPLFQGYDSVAVRADVELGGTDQLFNLQVGRALQKIYGQEPQCVLTVSMLLGLDGRKMSTTWGNVVNISDAPAEQFGKLMSMSDAEVPGYAVLAARFSVREAAALAKLHPREAKAKVAQAIVALYHGSAAARKAREDFDRVFQNKENPQEVDSKKVPAGHYNALELVMLSELVSSKSEAKRLIAEGAFSVDGAVIASVGQAYNITAKQTVLIRRGKRRFRALIGTAV